MKPTNHPHCNDVLRKPADMTDEECRDLPICRGSEYVTSFWKPSSEELIALNGGGCVALSIMGATHPPLSVDTCRPHEAQTGGRAVDPSEYFHRMDALNDRLQRLISLTKRIISAWVAGREKERVPLTDELLDSMLANKADGSFVGVHEAIDQTQTATQADVERYRADAEGWKREADRWRKAAEHMTSATEVSPDEWAMKAQLEQISDALGVEWNTMPFAASIGIIKTRLAMAEQELTKARDAVRLLSTTAQELDAVLNPGFAN
jgi:hypothetical protein